MSFLRPKCPQCGSQTLRYTPEKEGITCEHCGYAQALPRTQTQLTERALAEGWNLADAPQGLGDAQHAYHCNACGAETAMEQRQTLVQCPFCAATDLNEAAQTQRVITPAGLAPFVVPRQRALEAFRKWIQTGWFHPNALRQVREAQAMQGVYLPFWTYDAHTASTWTADAGHYYYETETYTDSEGKTKTRQVRHTRWESAGGYYETFFNDVLIVASKGLTQPEIEKIFPFDLAQVIDYDNRYLLGWECELYQRDLKEGFAEAERFMDARIEGSIIDQIPGDTYRNLRIQTQKNGLSFKHLLLPVWIAAYLYGGKSYRFIVNGLTGKVHGQKPYSALKIALAVLLGLLLAALALYLYEAYQQGQPYPQGQF